jgi:CRP/FNR family transcriptional regulator, cyclic AMP receptor protein
MKPAEIERYRGVLAESVPFRGLQPAAIEHIARQGLVLEAADGAPVSYEQMRGGIGLYVVLEGRVEVYRAEPPNSGAPDRQRHLNTLQRGQCFGEYSLLDGHSTSASARAIGASRLFFLPRGEFQLLVDQNPSVGKTIYRNLLLCLIERLRQKDGGAARDAD